MKINNDNKLLLDKQLNYDQLKSFAADARCTLLIDIRVIYIFISDIWRINNKQISFWKAIQISLPMKDYFGKPLFLNKLNLQLSTYFFKI